MGEELGTAAEHPPTDTGPVTADWLCRAFPGAAVAASGQMVGGAVDGWRLIAHVDAGVWVVGLSRDRAVGCMPCPTRADVVRLCRVFGVPIHEGE